MARSRPDLITVPGVPTVLPARFPFLTVALNGGDTDLSSFSEKLAAARAARPTKDVQVVLDGELSIERDRLLAQLENAGDDQRLGAKSEADEIRERLDALAEAAADSLVTLRFTRMPGREWAELNSHHPVRPDVPLDRHFGYNYDALCEDAAKRSGVRVEGDEVVSLTDEEWAELFDVLSGSEIGLIRDAVWSLNEYEPQQRLNTLVKGLGAATRSDKK